ncbi:hypothetical protein D3C80_1605100 [compost metagenome]
MKSLVSLILIEPVHITQLQIGIEMSRIDLQHFFQVPDRIIKLIQLLEYLAPIVIRSDKRRIALNRQRIIL